MTRAVGVGVVISRRSLAIGVIAYFGQLRRSFGAERGNADMLLVPIILDLKTPVDDLIRVPGTPAEARAMATRTLNACQAIAAESAIKIKQLHAMDDAIEKGRNDIDRLLEERDVALDQLRKGLYCSKCTHSKSEIEATGEDFRTHLKRVNGAIVAASPSVVRKKDDEYNARIENLESEQDLRVENRRRSNTYNNNLQQQLQEGVMLWRTAILLEHGAAETKFLKADELDSKRLTAVRDVLSQLENQERRLLLKLDGRDPDALLRLQRNQDEQTSWSERLTPIEKSIAGRKRNYENALATIKEQAAREVTLLSEAMASISGTHPFKMRLPDFSLSFGRWAVAISPEQAGVRFQFTRIITGGVSSQFDRNARFMESTAFIEVFGKVQIYAGMRTEFDDGATSITVGGLRGVGQFPSKDEPGDESWKNNLPR